MSLPRRATATAVDDHYVLLPDGDAHPLAEREDRLLVVLTFTQYDLSGQRQRLVALGGQLNVAGAVGLNDRDAQAVQVTACCRGDLLHDNPVRRPLDGDHVPGRERLQLVSDPPVSLHAFLADQEARLGLYQDAASLDSDDVIRA